MQKGFLTVNSSKTGEKSFFAKLGTLVAPARFPSSLTHAFADTRKKKLALCKSESSLIAAQSVDLVRLLLFWRCRC